MHLSRRLLTLLLGTMLLALPLLVVAPAQADPVSDPNTVISWGANWDGQATVPASLEDKTVTAISAGEHHSVALTSDGKITVWGANNYGEGNVPTSLDDKNVTAIAAGTWHSMALTSDGKVTAWGNNFWNQSVVPASLNDKTVTAISAGDYHSMALTDDGKITAWGYNYDGETTVPASLNDKTVTAISGGVYHSMALTSDGKITAWGTNGTGQIDVPASLNDKTVTAISAGYVGSMALTSDGEITVWGNNQFGQTDIPTSLEGKTVTAISAGHYHSMALTSDGKVTAWGYNEFGQATIPTSLDGKTVTAISAGSYYSLALRSNAGVDTGLTDNTISTAAGTSVSFTPEITGTFDDPDQWSVTDGDDTDDVKATIDPDTGEIKLSSTVAGNHKLTLTIPSASNGDFTATITLTVTPGAVDTLTVTPSAATAFSGETITLTATGADEYGNEIGDVTAGTTFESGTDGDRVDGNEVTFGSASKHTITGTHTPTDVTESTTVAVSLRDFVTGPGASITGTVKVGEELTAGTGSPMPEPDAYAYQWYADKEAIADADGKTFTPTSAEDGTDITVEVTAIKAHYANTADTSEPTAEVATDQDPAITLGPDDEQIRRGQSTNLTWSSTHADTLTASDAWSGDQDPDGTLKVSPTTIGTSTYVLTATNDNGTTTAQAAVEVIRPVTTNKVAATKGLVLRGKRTTIKATGLDKSEPYAIRIGAITVATGTTNGNGGLSRSVTVPANTDEGRRTVTVTGSENDRVGTTKLEVVRNKALGLKLKKSHVQASDPQKVTVSGLAAGEKVTVTFKGKRISARNAHANAQGVYTKSFTVGMKWGTKKVKATGQFAGRTNTKSFAVDRRTHDLGPRWR